MIKKWLKGLVDYCFGAYFQKLNDIHTELIKIRHTLESQSRETIPLVEYDAMGKPFLKVPSRGLQALRALQPLSKEGSSIFNSPQDKP